MTTGRVISLVFLLVSHHLMSIYLIGNHDPRVRGLYCRQCSKVRTALRGQRLVHAAKYTKAATEALAALELATETSQLFGL